MNAARRPPRWLGAKNVDLEIQKGEIFARLGPNGAGRTGRKGVDPKVVREQAGDWRREIEQRVALRKAQAAES